MTIRSDTSPTRRLVMHEQYITAAGRNVFHSKAFSQEAFWGFNAL
jgi:hypothetical protein